MVVPNDAVTWGFAAIAAGAVLWVALQRCDRFGVRDTILRAVVVVLIGTGAFTVGLETARSMGAAQGFLG